MALSQIILLHPPDKIHHQFVVSVRGYEALEEQIGCFHVLVVVPKKLELKRKKKKNQQKLLNPKDFFSRFLHFFCKEEKAAVDR